MFNPVHGSEAIKRDFIEYITTTLHFNSPEMRASFQKQLEEVIAKGPYVDLNSAFAKGKTVNQLIDDGVLSPLFRDLEADKPSNYKRTIPLDRPLYVHQQKAIETLAAGNNAVITTGTGSGKTECFLIPMLNELLREEENGTLSEPGVRAILIYPMNALANDQMKRLRTILMKYPKIRFGVFTGDTEQDGDVTPYYKELHKNEEYEELRTPLGNELMTRDAMIKTPPHILCTNYVMLERLLLAPNRAKVFHDAKIKFVILDEAHVYSGATGMETSLLIRRLVARIGTEGSKPQYVLTSATLGKKGEADKDINRFAENLTGVPFGVNNIIFGEREPYVFADEGMEYPVDLFIELANAKEEKYKTLFEKYGVTYDESESPQANIYDLCESSVYYHRLRQSYEVPEIIDEIANWMDLDADEAVAFLHVCTLASKNGSSLLDLRYHFFLRALEGLYMSLCGDKEIFLERKEKVFHGNDEDRVFEISICKNCGDLALVGHVVQTDDGRSFLENRDLKPKDDPKPPRFFHILRDSEMGHTHADDDDVDQQESDESDLQLEDRDKDEIPPKEEKPKKEFWLCPHCGEICEITPEDPYGPACGHAKKDFVRLRAFKSELALEDRCLYCFNGNYNRFYLGTEAATSVLATSLFEALPIKKVPVEQWDASIQEFDAGKQFLSFSDSRSEAAFFASYLDKTYQQMMERRALVTLLEKDHDDFANSPCPLTKVATRLAKIFEENDSFAQSLLTETSFSDKHDISIKVAWAVLLKELMTARRNGSLQSLGFLKFEYIGNAKGTVANMAKLVPGASEDDVKAALDELAMTFAYFGAIEVPDEANFGPEDMRKVFWCKDPKCIAESKTKKDANPMIGNWLPMARDNDPHKFYKTYRQEIVLKLLGDNSKLDEANVFLRKFFEEYLTNPMNPNRALLVGKKGYALSPSSFAISIPPQAKWYRCKRCGKLTTFNLKNKCVISKCGGELEEVSDIEKEIGENHYADFYRNPSSLKYLRKMLIKEHTAQLSKKDAAKYQTEFEKNEINALSCSTTFEMGVDVGELETVFLRNIPPNASNYAQRAGRAGRSKNSAAFVLSYAKLSSHDFNFYREPREMITGRIVAPSFKLDNSKIVYRHIFSVVFSYFFACYPNYFGGSGDFYEFLEKGGYDEFVKMMADQPDELKKLLALSFEDLDSEFGISDFSGKWVNALIGPEGRLTTAYNGYRESVDTLKGSIKDLVADDPVGNADQIKKLSSALGWRTHGSIIDWLVAANGLPKYGFPVDTVELSLGEKKWFHESGNDSLRLSRDMAQAISDYAPGSKIVADDQMYTSRYVAPYWKNKKKGFDTVWVSYCMGCGTMNVAHDDPKSSPTEHHCKGCNVSLMGVKWEEAILPSGGMSVAVDFNGKPKTESVPMQRPKKLYRTDYYFVEEDAHASRTVLNCGDELLTVISSKRDRIIVTSAKNQPFYVCPNCGFAYGYYDRIYQEKGKLDKEAMKILKSGTKNSMETVSSHPQPNGKPCGCKTLYKKHLYHSFNTDIFQIIFNGKTGLSSETQLSVLYALIGAISEVLVVDRTEIGGVVRHEPDGDSGADCRFIFFDNVPGGAGHVKRLTENDFALVQEVIDKAYEKMVTCKCDSSCYKCLRTYENQRIHDYLQRKDVEAFLLPYQGNSISIHESPTVSFVSEPTPSAYSDWGGLLGLLSNDCTQKAMDELRTIDKMPDILYPTIKGDGIDSSINPLFGWKEKMVFVFGSSQAAYVASIKFHEEMHLFVADDDIDVAKIISIINQ